VNVAGSAHRLFERRLHHARLHALVPDAVRRVSILDGDRVEIELDDPTALEREHLLHTSPSHAPPAEHAPGEPGPVPALAIAILIHSRPATVVMDNPTRARILENYKSATRRTRASASRPAG
jgi:hypothetical protein